MAKNKSYNKIIAGTMTAAMVAGVVTPAAAAGKSFPDVPADHWAADSINYLVDKGAINGKPDGTFGPTEEIDRASAAKIMAVTLGLEVNKDAKPSFEDAKNHWAAPYIAAVEKAGVIIGDGQGSFKPDDKVNRASMASMLVKAYKLDAPNAETKFDDLKGHWGEKDANILVALGISNGTDNGWAPNKAVTRAETAQFIAKTDAKYAKEQAKEAKVESVSAINASEIKVTFNTAVDKDSAEKAANYQLKVNNNEITDIQNITVSEDGKSATLLLDQTKVAFQNGDKYVIQINDDIKTKDGKNVAKFVSNEMTFSETAAPALVSVAKKGNNLELTFDRPVNSYKADKDVTLVKVDGVALAATDLKPVDAKKDNAEYLGKAGSYKYTVALNADEEKSAKTKGSHEVVIFDVAETAKDYAKVASVVSGTYTITDAVATPEVTGVEAVNANRFFLYTNTTVELNQNSKVTVNKGNHEFAMDTRKYDGTVSTPDTLVDAVVGTYKSKPGIWVTVTDDEEGNDENPLYRNGETSANLNVTVENFTADGLIGKKSTQSVTLGKSNTKPVVESTMADNGQLLVTFTNNLVDLDGNPLTALNAGDFVVRDNEGIVIEGLTATVNGKTVTISGPKFDAKAAPYTVDFKAGKFKNKEERANVATYLANTIKNDAISVKVGKKDAANFEYTEFTFDKTATTGNTVIDKNTITFKYNTKMDDSARDVANYTLDGKALPAGTTADFVGDRQTVRVTFPEGTFKNSTKYKFGITTNVKTQSGSKIVGSLQTKAPAELVFDVKDNVKPELASAIYYVGTEDVQNNTTTKKLELTFNENVKFSADGATAAKNDFAIQVNGSDVKVDKVETVSTGTNAERKLVLTLAQNVNVSQAATITVVPEEDQKGTDKVIAVLDLADNKAKEGSSTQATAYKYDASYAKEKQEADAAEAAKALEDAKLAAQTKIDAAGNAVQTSMRAAHDKAAAIDAAIQEALAKDANADTTALEANLHAAEAVVTKVQAELDKVADADRAAHGATTVEAVKAEVAKADAAAAAAANLVK
ncbi:S-layer homology domain-containing protein [Bacillus sp. NPDC094106]|uniref:S-layer homology domain-containing protein n=1 Tax=Bacillus sp. NPDC094106 TaxID=3363949 RepID=UPI003802C61C